jgi:cell division septation protein DedD
MVKRRHCVEETQLFGSSDPPPWFTFQVATFFERPWRIVGLVLLAGLALIGVRYYRSQLEPVPISLNLSEQDNQIQVRWNHSSPSIREAVRGTIEILDGDRSRSAALSADDLSYGNITYMGQTGDMQIRLEIENAKGQKTQEGVRFIEPFPFVKSNNMPVTADASEPLRTAQRTKSGPLHTELAKPPEHSSGVPSETYLQLAATSKFDAEIIVDGLRQKRFESRMAEIPEKAGTYRILVGPVRDGNLKKLRVDLQDAGFPGNGAIIRTF